MSSFYTVFPIQLEFTKKMSPYYWTMLAWVQAHELTTNLGEVKLLPPSPHHRNCHEPNLVTTASYSLHTTPHHQPLNADPALVINLNKVTIYQSALNTEAYSLTHSLIFSPRHNDSPPIQNVGGREKRQGLQ